MNLIPNWKDAWKFYSTRAMVVMAAIPSAWATLTPDLKAAAPDWVLPVVMLLALAAGVAGRVTQQ